MLVYLSHPTDRPEPEWASLLSSRLADRDVQVWRPARPVHECLTSTNRHLAGPDGRPRPAFVALAAALGLDDRLFGPHDDAVVLEWLTALDSASPETAQHARDLYGFVRADVVVADLEHPAPEVGLDLLFARMGGIATIALSNRYLHAPSVLARVDVLMFPRDVDMVVDVVASIVGANRRPVAIPTVLDRVKSVLERATREEAASHQVQGVGTPGPVP